MKKILKKHFFNFFALISCLNLSAQQGFHNGMPGKPDSTQMSTCGVDARYIKKLDDPVFLRSVWAQRQAASTANIMSCGRFNLIFQDDALGTGYGFDLSTPQGAQLQSCACAVATYIQSVFQIPTGDGTPIEIQFNQSWSTAFGNPAPNPFLLAVGGGLRSTPNYVGGVAGYYGGNAFEHYTTGVDPDPNQIDGIITVNFDQNFQNCNQPRQCGLYDLYSVLLHEFTHVLGWASAVQDFPIQSTYNTPNQFSKYDQYFLYWGSVTGALQHVVVPAGPAINGGLPGTADLRTPGLVWMQGNSQFDPANNQNYPVFASLPYSGGTVPPGSSSHIGDYQTGFQDAGIQAPGFVPNYVMAPSFWSNQLKQTYTLQELRALNTMGYQFLPAFLASNSINGTTPNGAVIPNRHPYTTKTIFTANWLNNAPYINAEIDDVAYTPADASITNCAGQQAVFNLSADASIHDADGDPIKVYPGSLYNIRGCGDGTGNNHNQLNVVSLPGGDVITFTPRPGFIGRAQFGFHLYDGLQKGAYMIYTIDVTGCAPCSANGNIVVNGNFEEGSEVKLVSNLNVDNTPIDFYRNEKYLGNYDRILTDGVIYQNTNTQIVKESSSCINTDDAFGWSGLSFSPGTAPLPATGGGNRYYYMQESNSYFNICTPPQTCQRFILEFDILTNTAINSLPVGFSNAPVAQFNLATNIINPVYQNIPASASWQHVAIPINYCSSITNCNYLMIQNPNATSYTIFYIDNLNLYLDPNPPVFGVTVTSNATGNTVCANNPIVLTATPTNAMCAVTYNWLAPINQTTQSVNVTPGVTTTYNVIVSDGCSNVNSNITINVNQPATINVTASPQTICAGYSSNLSVSPSLTGTIWMPGSLSGNNVTVSPGATTTYAVTGTDANGCQANGNVTLNVVNCCTAPNTLAANYSSSAVITGGPWTPSVLNTIVSGGTLTFNTANVIMPINSKITVMPGCTLRVINASNLWACTNNMWTGIEVQAGGRVEIYNKVKIEDAQVAVHIMNSATTAADFFIHDAFFNKNNKGMVIDPFNGTHPGLIYNTIFQCVPSTLTPNSSMATLSTTKNPFPGKRTAVGVEVNNVIGQISIGDLLGTNTFSGIDMGIHSINSKLFSIQNSFTGITYSICGTGFCPPVCTNTGICILAENGGTIVVGLTPSLAIATNNFASSANGVVTKNNVTSYILNNKFNNMNTTLCYPSNCVALLNNTGGLTMKVNKNDFNNFRTGVYVNTFNKCVVDISKNTFKHNPLGLGVYCLQNSGSQLTIDQNDFNGLPANQGNTGIRVQNTTLVTNGLTKITNNNIRRDIYGIVLTNYIRAFVTGNTINFYLNSAPSTASYGIWLQGSKSTFTDNNSISNSTVPNSSYVNMLYGIAVDPICQQSQISNNVITNMASGMRYAGASNLPVHVSCNFMTKDFYGIEIQDDIGDQGGNTFTYPPNGQAQDNQWTLNTNSGATGALRVGTPPQRNFFYRATGLPWMLNPSLPSQMNPTGFNSAFNLPSPIVSSAPYNCTNGCPPGIPSTCRTAQIAQLAKKQAPFQLQTSLDRVITIESSFRDITLDSTLYQSGDAVLDSTVIVFRDSLKQTTIGAFQEISTISESGNNRLAAAKNQLINPDPQKCTEIYRKTVNEIYLSTWAKGIFEFTPQDSTTLNRIANSSVDQCGTAVYDARVMLRIDLNDYSVNTGNGSRMAEDPSKQIEDQLGVMFPNPAQNKAFYEINLKENESGFVELFNMLGDQLATQQLNPGANKAIFDLSNINDGIYMYRVIINAEIKANRKLIITK